MSKGTTTFGETGEAAHFVLTERCPLHYHDLADAIMAAGFVLIRATFANSRSMAVEDLYAILGVLPDAEDVVIAAACRALAPRYHPGRRSGVAMEAQRHMSAINKACSVLCDEAFRSAYDRTRTQWQ